MLRRASGSRISWLPWAAATRRRSERIFERYPFVDVAFGPGSIPHLGEWIEAGGFAVPRGRFGTHETFAATLPMHRERQFSAWVQVSMGCNSKCACHRPHPWAGAEPPPG